MRAVAVDTETWPIQKGRIAPPLVCLSKTGPGGHLFDRAAGIEQFKTLLADPAVRVVGHNFAFDAAVLLSAAPEITPALFRAYRDGRISDTLIREKLIMLSRGHLEFYPTRNGLKPTKYSMGAIAERRLGLDMSEDKTGEDSWRLRYAELDGVPLAEWPQEAKDYAINDALVTLRIWQDQCNPPDTRIGPIADGPELIANEGDQVRADFALQLQTCWGLRTDPEAVAALRRDLEAEVAEANETLIAAGLVRRDGTKDMKAIRSRVENAFGGSAPSTEKGATKTDAETLLKSGDPTLKVLADVSGSSKILSAFIPVLESGTQVPINPSYDILKETGRTSSYGPNIQQLPRKGGVRECFVPRDGYWFVSIDYDTLELRAWAQVCLDLFGHSDMAEAFLRGLDPHLDFAASLMGVDYTEVEHWKSWTDPVRKGHVKDMRQLAKVANFGFPGGLGSETFVDYAAAQGVIVTSARSRELREAWGRQWSEHRAYFDMVSQWVADTEETAVRIDRTGLIRGSARYTAACNMMFQGLAAAGAKRALWACAEASYALPSSPAFGARPAAFIHDEILAEVPIPKAHAASEELARLMREAMSTVIPDIPIGATPALMRRWYKDAEPTYENGILVPWEPTP